MKDMSERTRVAFYIERGLLKKCDTLLEIADARSRNEFMNKALEYYVGYMQSRDAQNYIAIHLSSCISGIVGTSENRISRLLFKLAVEMSMMMNVIAETTEMGEGYLRKLRGKCVEDVKKSLGAITFNEVIKRPWGE